MHPPDPLRLCTDQDCECFHRHYENCRDCYGWGLTAEFEIPAGCLGPEPRRRAISEQDFVDTGECATRWIACPTCGSTPAGAPGG